jgi:carboxyl-terminal processing protease
MKKRRIFQAPKIQKETILFFSLVLILMVLSYALGFFSQELFPNPAESFSILRQSYQILRDHGLKVPLDAKKLEYGMIRGMIQAYDDPYTSFLEPPQNELQSDQLQGKFGGIGVRIEQDAQKYYLLYPLPDSPAEKAGIQDGDRLLMVDNLIVTSQTTVDAVQAAIRGPVGRIAEIQVGRPPDYSRLKFSLTRVEVAVPSVTYNLASFDPSIGVIQVNIIAATGPDELKKAVADLKSRGATRFILDLRNNGGGLVESGVDMARLFLKSDIVIEEQFRGEAVRTFNVDHPGDLTDLPLVVVVNQNTASAAEILAGSLQVQHRAMLVGTHTYGKDTVQLAFDLKDGSSLHVTTGHWWLPDRQNGIASVGLQPDVPLSEDDANSAAALEKAAQTFQK